MTNDNPDKLSSKQIGERLEKAKRCQSSHCFNEAEQIYQDILKQRPDHLETLYSLTLLYINQNKMTQAFFTIRKAVFHYPKLSYLHNTYAALLKKNGQIPLALKHFRHAIELQLSNHPAWNNIGNTYREKNNLPMALACYEKALEYDPHNLTYRLNHLNCLVNLKGYSEAIKKSIFYLKKDPKCVELLLLRAFALNKLKRYQEAIKIGKHAIDIDPKSFEAYHCMGNFHFSQHHYAEALKYYKKAVECNPDNEMVALCVGQAYLELHELNHGIDEYNRLIAKNPRCAEAHFYLGFLYLMMGNYTDGWREYEWRWLQQENLDNRHTLPKPQWQGESLDGKKLLVHSEQGYGDIIMLCRFISLIPETAHIILESRLALLSLMVSSFKNIKEGVAKGDQLPDFDLEISISSLPLSLKITLDSLPVKIPYLQPTAESIKTWQAIIPASKQLKIGIAWSGSKTNPQHFRSCTLDFFKRLFSVPNTMWFSLQKAEESDWQQYPAIINLEDQLLTFTDTAAAILQLDLVISIDTSVAHLTGALGKPVWTLLSTQIDWRWMLQREDSLWYPTMRLFRQPVINDWKSVFNRVYDELLALAQGDQSKLKPIPWIGPPAVTDKMDKQHDPT